MTDIVERWKNRYTVRSFYEDQIPDIEKINQLNEIIKYIPSQQGVVDHQWVLLTPQDKDFKEWLVDEVYNRWSDDDQHLEYFSMIAEAPYVYHSFSIKITPPFFIFKDSLRTDASEFDRSAGFHAGAILSTALELGLDTALICCTASLNRKDKDKNKIIKEYRERIWNRFGEELSTINIQHNNVTIYFKKENIFDPSITISVGTGKPLTKDRLTPYKNGIAYTGGKSKKWFNNFVK